MKRTYRQVKQPDGTHKFVEITAGSVAVHGINTGDFQPYRSPIDGTIITSERAHADHKRKHDVVEHREFGTDHWDRKAKERADYYAGKRSTAETFRRKQEINEIINRHERG